MILRLAGKLEEVQSLCLNHENAMSWNIVSILSTKKILKIQPLLNYETYAEDHFEPPSIIT